MTFGRVAVRRRRAWPWPRHDRQLPHGKAPSTAKQVTVVASNAFTHDDFRRSMSFLSDGRVRAQPLHSRTVRLDELEATLRGLSAGPSDDIKVLVDPRRS